MTRPWHRSDEHPVTLATHSRRPRLQKAEARAEIQRPPPTPALALVIARAAPPATGTAIAVPGARADRHHQRPVRLEFYLFDHNSVQSEQRLSYPQWAHVAVLSRGVPDLEAGNPMSAAACAPPQPPSGEGRPKRRDTRWFGRAPPSVSGARSATASATAGAGEGGGGRVPLAAACEEGTCVLDMPTEPRLRVLARDSRGEPPRWIAWKGLSRRDTDEHQCAAQAGA